MLAGEIVGRVAGSSWSDFVAERLFAPLDMKSSYTSTTQMLAEAGEPTRERNMFFPAVKNAGQSVAGDITANYCDAICGPAGGIWSTPEDLAKYVQFLANDGVGANGTVVPTSVLEDAWAVQVDVDRVSGFFDHPTAPVSYSRGWASYEHAGFRVFEHGGGFMSSFIAVIPGADAAVGVFSNAFFFERAPFEGLYFLSPIKLRAIDTLLGAEPADWSRLYAAELAEAAP